MPRITKRTAKFTPLSISPRVIAALPSRQRAAVETASAALATAYAIAGKVQIKAGPYSARRVDIRTVRRMQAETDKAIAQAAAALEILACSLYGYTEGGRK